MSRLAFLNVVFVCVLLGQSDRGTITGRVTDPTGAGVPNATVAATAQETGVKYTAQTTESGVYSIQQLPVGRYDVAVEATGFRRLLQKDIEINVAQTLTLNAALEVGQVEQSVEVTASAGLVESSTSDVGTVISRERIIDLPLSINANMRSPEAFIFLAPGVTGNSRDTQINGSQSRAKEVLLDGIGSTSPESGGILFTYPSVEAIGEFKLVSSNFSAEYGRTGGGFEVFTTRSGTNEWHGSLFEYFRNDKLDARGFFAPSTPINRQNEFGGALGGPVWIPGLYKGTNRTFFHVVYSGFRFRGGATNEFFSIPSEAIRRGDFSGLGRPIYDPRSTRIVNGQVVRDQFPNNIIPQDQFSTVGRNMIALLPPTTRAGQLNNFLSVGAQRFMRDQVNVKLDHNFSDRNRVNAFAYIGTQNNVDPERLPAPFTSSLDRDYRSRWLRLNHDFIFTPNSLNNFRVGFTREGEFWRKLSVGEDWSSRLGLRGIVGAEGSAFPRVQFTEGLSTWADDSKSIGSQVNNAFQLNDTLSYIRGNHSLKFGGEGRWLQTNGADFFYSQGNFNFSALETGLPGVATSGHAFASFLLGAVNRGEQNVVAYVPGNRYRYLAAFVQDDWKATRKLTLNLGFRYEIYFPRSEQSDTMSGFVPDLPNPLAANRLGAVGFLGEGPGRLGRSSFADTYYRNFGPRAGFAYSLFEKTVLRGGYGIYYAPGNATTGLRTSQVFTFGFNSRPTPATLDNGVTPAFYWDQGFPQNFPIPPVISPSVANGFDVHYIGRTDGRPPYFQNFTFSIQQELPGRMMIEAAYVGIKGTRLGTGLMNINEVDPAYLSLGRTLSLPITSPEAIAAGIQRPYSGFSGSVAQALRPYPQYNRVENRSNPNGNSTYHGLQTKFEKRFSRGLSVLGNYTWSKTLSDSDVQAGGGPSGQTFYNRRLEKAISTNDVPHIFNLSYVYELPFGRGKRYLSEGIASIIAGGWSVTGIHQYQAGRPIALSATNTLPLGNGVLRPDVIIGEAKRVEVDEFDPARDRWINRAAFAVPSAFRFGTAARAYTDLRAPAFYNESFGVIKRTPLTEAAVLTFRAEFFNAFNRVQFAAPAANISNANFGAVSGQANTPRQGQLALRLDF
jgi:hypothetical protein